MGAAVLVKHKRIVNRLGNLTLITASSNSHLSNKSLEFKLAGNRNGMCSISGCLDHYIDSPYQLTKRIATSYPDLMEEFLFSKIASSETATLRWCFEFIEQRTSELIDLIEASNLWGFKG